ncbi:hypothetical protein [Methanoplanus endosymbiosus]|uniref:Uncharacterized protein n=1 Tax=Methanoplanus endosymbiosus TaxID=33865 RepID=A0A9E7PR05_9EURY|nr:hypothetical protein [Methanoplanus endosymbiosus]UUX93369.1 hypothetical protein L6E24_04375 [Methanoplanus endosymbiosus]
MRRIYHRFPLRCDLDFDIEMSFYDAISKVISLNNTHTTSKRGEDLVKLAVQVDVADRKTNMISVDEVPDLAEVSTDTVDFRINLIETILTGDRRIPRAGTSYLLKVRENGMITQCFIVKEGTSGDTDAFDIKKMIKGE